MIENILKINPDTNIKTIPENTIKNNPENKSSTLAEDSSKDISIHRLVQMNIESPEPGGVKITLGKDPLKKKNRKFNLDDNSPELYLNREFTWLNFNRRVLHEAENENNPLLERVKFLAISASTLDEFIMKRIGGLKLIAETSPHDLSIDGRSAKDQIIVCNSIIRKIIEDQHNIFVKLLRQLKKAGIEIVDYKQLNNDEKDFARNYFIRNIFPLITPQGIDQAHPFPFISNLSLNLLVAIQPLKHKHEKSQTESTKARVKIPIGADIPRFLQIERSNEKAKKYIKIEDVIRHNLDMLFPGLNIVSSDIFRVTRNANTEKDEEKADDLLELIENEIHERKFAPIVRLQVEKKAHKRILEFLTSELGIIYETDIFPIKGMIGLSDLFEIASRNIPELRFKSHHPIDPPRLKKAESIMENILREGPVLIFHPYESFEGTVERFLREASNDPAVRAIKMTLYRTSKNSEIIKYLMNAVQKGKQVAVVIELKARFDEKANIDWANQLEEAGIHVTYGVIGLKTHAKIIMVVRKDEDRIRIYTHTGTGNYHNGTARTYTDLGIIQADEAIGNDMTELFNFLTTGLSPHRHFQKILMSPGNLKKSFLRLIHHEIELHEKKNPGLIRMKMNALDDPDIVNALYKASCAGVRVELIVRDSCRLRPGIPGLSENITVKSIVGRFLEHFRLYYFRLQDQYYLGSVDLMRRSLTKRVEILIPAEDASIKKELESIFDIQLSDKYTSWKMECDGSYIQSIGTEQFPESQEVFIDIANQRFKASEKVKRVLSKGKSKKEGWAGY